MLLEQNKYVFISLLEDCHFKVHNLRVFNATFFNSFYYYFKPPMSGQFSS